MKRAFELTVAPGTATSDDLESFQNQHTAEEGCLSQKQTETSGPIMSLRRNPYTFDTEEEEQQVASYNTHKPLLVVDEGDPSSAEEVDESMVRKHMV